MKDAEYDVIEAALKGHVRDMISKIGSAYGTGAPQVINLLKSSPGWETPEQWEKRTGEPWPDNAAVYRRFAARRMGPWSVQVCRPRTAWGNRPVCLDGYQTVCADKLGPPPDDWEYPASGEQE